MLETYLRLDGLDVVKLAGLLDAIPGRRPAFHSRLRREVDAVLDAQRRVAEAEALSLDYANRRPLPADFEAVVAELVRWATKVRQPATAQISHHGMGLAAGDWDVSLAAFGRPASESVLVVIARWPAAIGAALSHPVCLQRYAFTAEQWAEVRAMVERYAPVMDSWNGPGCTTGSLRLRLEVHPSHGAAVDRGLQGRGDHDAAIPPRKPTGRKR